MAWQLWPALAPEDRLRVPAEPPSEYLEYLHSLGFVLPEFGVKPDRDRLFTPFGWNREAEQINRNYRNLASHPDVEINTRVNSRAFGQLLEADLISAHGIRSEGFFCNTSEDLRKWLGGASIGRWVAKGNHGHAGIGQLRFALPNLSPEVRENLIRILETQGGLLVEREHDIHVEFGCLFMLRSDGSMGLLRCHRLLSYSGGGFAGALHLPGDLEFERWRGEIEQAVTRIGECLHREGYFGPVGIDVYVWRDGDRFRFRPLVDLNARCSMAYPVHGLSSRFPERAVLTSQVPATISLPASPEALRDRLGEIHFDPQTRHGAFLITPLMPGPRRHAWAFIGRDEEDLKRMQDEVLRALA